MQRTLQIRMALFCKHDPFLVRPQSRITFVTERQLNACISAVYNAEETEQRYKQTAKKTELCFISKHDVFYFFIKKKIRTSIALLGSHQTTNFVDKVVKPHHTALQCSIPINLEVSLISHRYRMCAHTPRVLDDPELIAGH